MKIKHIILILIITCATQVVAEVKFRFPMDQSSWFGVNAFRDSKKISNEIQDFTCGTKTYNEHEGVDFRYQFLGAFGVAVFDKNVVAGASGVAVQLENSCSPTGGYWNNGCGGGLGNHAVLEHDVVTRTADRYFGGHFTV